MTTRQYDIKTKGQEDNRTTRQYDNKTIWQQDNMKTRQFWNQWPNLKNLSGGLNLSRGLNMVGST